MNKSNSTMCSTFNSLTHIIKSIEEPLRPYIFGRIHPKYMLVQYPSRTIPDKRTK